MCRSSGALGNDGNGLLPTCRSEWSSKRAPSFLTWRRYQAKRFASEPGGEESFFLSSAQVGWRFELPPLPQGYWQFKKVYFLQAGLSPVVPKVSK